MTSKYGGQVCESQFTIFQEYCLSKRLNGDIFFIINTPIKKNLMSCTKISFQSRHISGIKFSDGFLSQIPNDSCYCGQQGHSNVHAVLSLPEVGCSWV